MSLHLESGGSSSNSKLYKAGDDKTTAYVVLVCLTAASGGLLFGYDLGISGGVSTMDDFLLKFFPKVYRKKNDAKTDNYCKFDSQLLTLFTSSLYFAGLIASFVASRVTRDYGRRVSILTGGICFLLGSILDGVAQNFWMLLLGRIILGVGLGFTNQAVPLYLSEMAPSKLRREIDNNVSSSHRTWRHISFSCELWNSKYNSMGMEAVTELSICSCTHNNDCFCILAGFAK